MSILKVDTINEKTSGNGVAIPGHVVQVVQGTFTGTLTLNATNNTHTDTGLTATITPKFSSSKILIHHNASIVFQDNQDVIIRLLRGSTNIWQMNAYTSNSQYGMSTAAFSFLDSPSTTSATTYKTDAYKNQGNFWYNYANEVQSKATLTLMEIAQ